MTVHQLSTGRSTAGTGGGPGAAGQDADYQDYPEGGVERGSGGRGGGQAGSRSNAYPQPNNYRNDYDERDYYAAASGSSYGRGRGGYEDYPPAPLPPQMPYGERERERDRDRDKNKDYDRHRSKHKKKHNHRQSSRSRSRSRSQVATAPSAMSASGTVVATSGAARAGTTNTMKSVSDVIGEDRFHPPKLASSFLSCSVTN